MIHVNGIYWCPYKPSDKIITDNNRFFLSGTDKYVFNSIIMCDFGIILVKWLICRKKFNHKHEVHIN